MTDTAASTKTAMDAMTSFAHNPDQPEKRKGKAYVRLVNSEMLMAEMQIVSEGGENNMHSHPATDGFWWVVRGTARFYDENDQPTEVGTEEGIFVPRGVPYWFEKGGDEPLHMLHIAARTPNPTGEPNRINVRPRNDPPPDPKP